MIITDLFLTSILLVAGNGHAIPNQNTFVYDDDLAMRYQRTFNISTTLDDNLLTFKQVAQPENVPLFSIDFDVPHVNALGFYIQDFSQPINVYCSLSVYLGSNTTHQYHRIFNLAQNNYNSSEILVRFDSTDYSTFTLVADFHIMPEEEYNYYRSLYDNGMQQGYTQGHNTGFQEGKQQGYTIGYSQGYEEASEQQSTAVTIFAGICEVGLLPINVFLQFFNFEVFGINISALVLSIMTIAITIIIIRMVTGKKDD